MRGLLLGMAAMGSWSSAAFLITFAAGVMDQGPRGLWGPLMAASGPVLCLIIMAQPWRRTGALTLPDLWNPRFISSGARSVSGIFSLLVCLLFAIAQFAAVRDLTMGLGWPLWAVLGPVGVLALGWAAGEEGQSLRYCQGAGVLLALTMLLAVFVMSAVHTDPRWERVWDRAASQPRFNFPDQSPAVTSGLRVVGDPAHPLSWTFEEEHQITSVSGGRLALQTMEGVRYRKVEGRLDPGQSLALRNGDVLTVLEPQTFRFQAGKRVPGAPPMGPWWADGGQVQRPLKSLGLLVTLLGGAVVFPPLLFALRAQSRGPAPAGRWMVFGLISLFGMLPLWGTYSLAYAPELFVTGLRNGEWLKMPEMIGVGGRWKEVLGGLGAVGVCLIGWSGAASALRAATVVARADLFLPQGESPWIRHLIAWPLGLMALVVSVELRPGAWLLTLWALGLGASTLVPLGLFACWARRFSAPVALAGVMTGGASFLVLAGVGLVASKLGVGTPNPLLSYPALVSLPLSLLTMLLLGFTVRPTADSDRAFSRLHLSGPR